MNRSSQTQSLIQSTGFQYFECRLNEPLKQTSPLSGTIEDCQTNCLSTNWCNSFDYCTKNNWCQLNSMNSENYYVPQSLPSVDYADYFECRHSNEYQQKTMGISDVLYVVGESSNRILTEC